MSSSEYTILKRHQNVDRRLQTQIKNGYYCMTNKIEEFYTELNLLNDYKH